MRYGSYQFLSSYVSNQNMYSVLKTLKTSLAHKKSIPPSDSIFLTDMHVLLAFQDASFQIFWLQLSHSKQETHRCIQQGTTSAPITHIARLSDGKCVVITKKCTQLILLELCKNEEGEMKQVKMTSIEFGLLANSVIKQNDSSAFINMGGHIHLHGFTNDCFAIQYFLHEDKKIVLDCYKKGPQNNYILSTKEFDLQLNGNYIFQPIDRDQACFALYKQTEIDEADWLLKVYSPFQYNDGKGEGPSPQQQIGVEDAIILPSNHFKEGYMILQVIRWLQKTMLIMVADQESGKLFAYRVFDSNSFVAGLQPNKKNYHFEPLSLPFLKSQFPLILSFEFIDIQKQVFYALSQAHQRIDMQLYENKVIIGNMRNGNIIQQGYCTLKNFNVSPNGRAILDMPSTMQSFDETLFHIRLLLSKSSLYMFLMQNSSISCISDNLKENILSMLM